MKLHSWIFAPGFDMGAAVLKDMSDEKVMGFFPIASQTSTEDKRFLLGAMYSAKEESAPFKYVEIGSFLGGSLTPFLMEPGCKFVLSIDERGRQQPDERGALYDYGGITTQTMLDKLRSVGVSTDKIQTFDGSIDNLPKLKTYFDLAFIDGEHTDEAAFRDSLYLLPLLKRDSIIMYHDSSLVYRAIRMVLMMIRKDRSDCAFFKRVNSEMSAILLGRYAALPMERYLGQREDDATFYNRSAIYVLDQKIRNMVTFNPQINEPKIIKAY